MQNNGFYIFGELDVFETFEDDGAATEEFDMIDDQNAQAALLKAFSAGDYTRAMFMLEVHPEMDLDAVKDVEDGWRPLHFSVSHGELEMVKYLIDNRKVNVNARNTFGGTPLMLAALFGRFDIFDFLIEHGATFDLQDYKEGKTALMFSVEKGLPHFCHLLIACRADLNLKDKRGMTAFHYALVHGHLNICKLLEANGAELDARDRDGNTALHIAAAHDRSDICEYLLRRGVRSTIRNQFGHTPMRGILTNGNFQLLKKYCLASGESQIYTYFRFNNSVDAESRTAICSYLARDWLRQMMIALTSATLVERLARISCIKILHADIFRKLVIMLVGVRIQRD
jgi:ankyrin repeat protein